jgi:hypothetical protein
MPLEVIARIGERLGAAAIVMSEHDFDFDASKWECYLHACQRASTARCTIVPGIEYSSSNDDIHVVTVGSSDFHGARRDLVETLSAVREGGGAAILAHPRRRDAFHKAGNELLELLDGIEIWNRKLDGLIPVDAFYKFARSNSLAPIVAMDLHTWRQIFPMWNEIPAGSDPIEGSMIANALRRRETTPACIAGKLGAALDRGFSLGLSALAIAENLRCLVRGVRDAVRPG